MKVYDAASIRNIALVGHGGSGKTQLVSALLLASGAVNRLGKVDDGSTVTDYDDESIARKHTLGSSLAYLEWRRQKVNVVDTPGFSNFLADARAALRVTEGVLLCVDAVSGVEVQTERMWAETRHLGLPRLVVVTRLDRERASMDRTMESIQRCCGRDAVPTQIPLGEEGGFTGVIDLVGMKAFEFDGGGTGRMTEVTIPGHLETRASAARDALIERVAEADESLIETFFSQGTLSQEQLVQGLKASTASGRLVPALCTSGLHVIGCQPLLDAVIDYVPSPAERPFPVTTSTGEPATMPAEWPVSMNIPALPATIFSRIGEKPSSCGIAALAVSSSQVGMYQSARRRWKIASSKNIQNHATKNITSDAMNRIIP